MITLQSDWEEHLAHITDAGIDAAVALAMRRSYYLGAAATLRALSESKGAAIYELHSEVTTFADKMRLGIV